MDDLVTWLRACLDEDEAWARATEGDEVADWIAGETRDNGEPTAGAHIKRWRPSRVLAEVEATRRILDLHPHLRFAEPLSADSPFEEDRRPAFVEAPRYVGCQTCDWDHDYDRAEPNWWCQTVRLLALPYAGQPGYRSEEWAP